MRSRSVLVPFVLTSLLASLGCSSADSGGADESGDVLVPAGQGGSPGPSAGGAAAAGHAGSGVGGATGTGPGGANGGTSAGGKNGVGGASNGGSSAAGGSNGGSSAAGASSGGASAAGGSGTGGAPSTTAKAMIQATPGSGDGPLTVALSACSSTASADDPLVFYAWDFGDGFHATGAEVSHVFSRGAPTVTLTVTTASGGYASATKSLTIGGAPSAALVTTKTGHPRLYTDAAHADVLRQRVAAVPVLSAPTYPDSYVDGYLLQTNAWEAAGFYAYNYSGCDQVTTSGGKTTCVMSPPTGASCMHGNEVALGQGTGSSSWGNPFASGRRISDCLTTIAAGSFFSKDAHAAAWAKDAISGLLHMATVWPTTGASNQGFGRWICGSCGAGSNLNNGELLYSTAVVFDLVHDQMTDTERTAVRDLLVREARWVYQAASGDPAVMGSKYIWWSMDASNNWEAVILGGMGVAALVLEGEPGVDAKETSTWIAYARDHVLHYLDTNFDADGVNFEDIIHAEYGAGFAAQFLWAQRQLKGVDDFGHRDGILHKWLRYRLAAIEPTFDGVMPNDAGQRQSLTWPTELLLASAYKDGFAQWEWDRLSGASRQAWNKKPFKGGGDGVQAQLLQTPFLYDDAITIESPENRLPLAHVYPDFGRALFRTGWEDPKGISLAAESGVYGSHGRPNQGSFFLTAYGEHLIDQLHTHDANKLPKDPSTGKVIAALEDRSLGYDVVLVDGASQKGQSTDGWLGRRAKTSAWLDAPALDFVSYDETLAYPTLSAARRDFLFVRPTATAGAYVVLLDDLAAAAAHDLDFNLHQGTGTWGAPQSGHAHLGAANGVGLEVLGTSSNDATWTITSADTTTGSAADDTLTVSLSGAKAASFLTLLFPTDGAHALPTGAAATRDASGLHLVTGTDHVVFHAGGTSLSGAASDGDILFARDGGSFFFAAKATHLDVAGAAVMTVSAPAAIAYSKAGDEIQAWLGAEPEATKVDVTFAMPTGAYVVVVDDVATQVTSSATVSLSALDVTKPHAIRLVPAKAKTTCP